MNTAALTIVEATAQSLDEFIALLEQVGDWLWQKGVKQWQPGVHYRNREKMADWINRGCLILAYHPERLAGGCVLSTVAPAVWSDAAADALYLSTLAVARFAAGQGVGAQIIDACTQATARRGKSRLRLDCWDGNDFLKSYYRQHGFNMLQTIPVQDYYVRLFEKPLLAGPTT